MRFSTVYRFFVALSIRTCSVKWLDIELKSRCKPLVKCHLYYFGAITYTKNSGLEKVSVQLCALCLCVFLWFAAAAEPVVEWCCIVAEKTNQKQKKAGKERKAAGLQLEMRKNKRPSRSIFMPFLIWNRSQGFAANNNNNNRFDYRVVSVCVCAVCVQTFSSFSSISCQFWLMRLHLSDLKL